MKISFVIVCLVVLLGPSASGKTSVVFQYLKGDFDSRRDPTIGKGVLCHTLPPASGARRKIEVSVAKITPPHSKTDLIVHTKFTASTISLALERYKFNIILCPAAYFRCRTL